MPPADIALAVSGHLGANMFGRGLHRDYYIVKTLGCYIQTNVKAGDRFAEVAGSWGCIILLALVLVSFSSSIFIFIRSGSIPIFSI